MAKELKVLNLSEMRKEREWDVYMLLRNTGLYMKRNRDGSYSVGPMNDGIPVCSLDVLHEYASREYCAQFDDPNEPPSDGKPLIEEF